MLRFVRSAPCETCGGSRLGAHGRTARIGDATLPELGRLTIERMRARLAALPTGPVGQALLPSVDVRLQRLERLKRLERLERLSLGHLSLDRVSTSLSGGSTS